MALQRKSILVPKYNERNIVNFSYSALFATEAF